MRSTQRPGTDDLTAKARIRNAAVRRFATDGMSASLRTVAADAGVSAGLILHHFGSRAGLREACDAHVIAEVRQNKTGVLGQSGDPGAFLAQLAQIEEYAPLVGYVLRCLQAGDGLATHFVDQLVADAVGYLDDAVQAGTVRPSRDPQARARVMCEQGLGALLLQLPARQDHLDLDELPGWLRAYSERIMLPLLEIYTEPLLNDSTLLDAYLAARPDGEATGTAHPACAAPAPTLAGERDAPSVTPSTPGAPHG